MVRGELALGDWKTSKRIYDEYWLQIAAYVMAFKELTGVNLDGGFICCIRDGKVTYEEKTFTELEVEFDAFLHALALHKWKNNQR